MAPWFSIESICLAAASGEGYTQHSWQSVTARVSASQLEFRAVVNIREPRKPAQDPKWMTVGYYHLPTAIDINNQQQL